MLRISVGDFTRQLRTMTVEHAQSESQRLRLLARFGAMFAGNLWGHYGGIFGDVTPLDPDAPPRVKRPLRCGVPEVHVVETDDGVELQLLRYRGGDRGPVVLVHGMGACSGLFTTDTIDTNLTEYLWEQGFDVWLLDWRGSILIPASNGTFDADECARYDYPAASRRIMELTGADGLHWIVHCVGSITFFMSLLGGLEDVESVVALQVAAHPVPPRMTKIKCALHVPALLQKLGMEALSAETYGEGFADRAFNQALRLTPLPKGERCSSAVCLRCTFLYSLCWVHANLTAETHDAMHEMMGVANLEMMEHLARCASHERLVDVNGDDVVPPAPRPAVDADHAHPGRGEPGLDARGDRDHVRRAGRRASATPTSVPAPRDPGLRTPRHRVRQGRGARHVPEDARPPRPRRRLTDASPQS